MRSTVLIAVSVAIWLGMCGIAFAIPAQIATSLGLVFVLMGAARLATALRAAAVTHASWVAGTNAVTTWLRNEMPEKRLLLLYRGIGFSLTFGGFCAVARGLFHA